MVRCICLDFVTLLVVRTDIANDQAAMMNRFVAAAVLGQLRNVWASFVVGAQLY